MTIAGLKAHANLYGSEGVVETAVDYGYDVLIVADLIEHCDKADIKIQKKRRRFTTVKKHRLSYVQRAERAMGIDREEKE